MNLTDEWQRNKLRTIHCLLCCILCYVLNTLCFVFLFCDQCADCWSQSSGYLLLAAADHCTHLNFSTPSCTATTGYCTTAISAHWICPRHRVVISKLTATDTHSPVPELCQCWRICPIVACWEAIMWSLTPQSRTAPLPTVHSALHCTALHYTALHHPLCTALHCTLLYTVMH